jgi:hypothetical protein
LEERKFIPFWETSKRLRKQILNIISFCCLNIENIGKHAEYWSVYLTERICIDNRIYPQLYSTSETLWDYVHAFVYYIIQLEVQLGEGELAKSCLVSASLSIEKELTKEEINKLQNSFSCFSASEKDVTRILESTKAAQQIFVLIFSIY